MKRVLVTGGSGFIGSHCLEPLLHRSFDVHAVSTRPHPGAITAVTWHAADLLDPAAATALVAEVQPSHLLHLAWIVTPGEMILSPQVSSIDQTTSIPISANVSAPVIDISSADTVVVTPDKQTVVIGGLIQDQKTKSETKIPLLGDIPGLGALFRHRITTSVNSELIIFLTPHIVQAPTQLAALSDSEREKSKATQGLTEKELDLFLDSLPKKPKSKKTPK